MISPVAFVSFAVVGVGSLALWANPRRKINRFFFSASVHVSLWLICVSIARDQVDGFLGLKWLRTSAVVGAFIPLHLWLLKEVIAGDVENTKRVFWRLVGWIISTAFLSVIPLTYSFVPAYSTPENPIYGNGYYVYVSGLLLAYAFLCKDTLVKMRRKSGVKKIELQIALLGGSVAAIVVLGLMALRTFIVIPGYIQPIVILSFYSFTAIAITTHRIFDARHILSIAIQHLLLLLSVTLISNIIWQLVSDRVPESLAVAAVVLSALLSANWLNFRLDVWLVRYPKAVQARLAAFNAAHSEIRTEELRAAFGKVLVGWGQSDRSIFLIDDDDGDVISGNGIVISKNSGVFAALKEIQWATPERLDRERETPERSRLSDFLEANDFGVLVYEQGHSMTMVVGLGIRPSRKPFTFPEVNQLRELVSIFYSSLSRTQLLAKAQRAEQLATVGLLGASVAHEIRNPLVSIKAFAQLLPKHHHDPVFRERFSRVIVDEVGRIDRLTEQLLDLAAPHTYVKTPVALNTLIRTSLELVAARVSSRNMRLRTELVANPDLVFSDANGLKQVILNLCFNAVQAQETKPSESQIDVRLQTFNRGKNIELVVSDNGPGIQDDSRNHLFEPFHSTKSNGFGLGLTVCSEILSSLDSSISLDPYEPGKGAVFRVSLPCPPRSS
jgi:C4-dicarboxylate-specific signal transduction histidine kinase